MLNIWVGKPCWIDIKEKGKSEDWRDSCHHDSDWQEILVPELELLVTTWHEVDASEVHDDH